MGLLRMTHLGHDVGLIHESPDEHVLLVHADVIGGNSGAQHLLLAPVHWVFAVGRHVSDERARPFRVTDQHRARVQACAR